MCPPLGIAAWVMGNSDLKEMDAGVMDASGRSTTNAGRICGLIATILLAMGIIIFIAIAAMGVIAGVARG